MGNGSLEKKKKKKESSIDKWWELDGGRVGVAGKGSRG